MTVTIIVWRLHSFHKHQTGTNYVVTINQVVISSHIITYYIEGLHDIEIFDFDKASFVNKLSRPTQEAIHFDPSPEIFKTLFKKLK